MSQLVRSNAGRVGRDSCINPRTLKTRSCIVKVGNPSQYRQGRKIHLEAFLYAFLDFRRGHRLLHSGPHRLHAAHSPAKLTNTGERQLMTCLSTIITCCMRRGPEGTVSSTVLTKSQLKVRQIQVEVWVWTGVVTGLRGSTLRC